MSQYIKTYWSPTCSADDCPHPAQYRLRDPNGKGLFGEWCNAHADEQVDVLNKRWFAKNRKRESSTDTGATK